MMRQIRSRRAGRVRNQDRARPLYARLLRLRHLNPSGFLCFAFFEGAVALGILLALAELVSWWGVLVLPVTVALMVKLNDVIAGTLAPVKPSGGARVATAGGPPSRIADPRAGVGSGRGSVARGSSGRRSADGGAVTRDAVARGAAVASGGAVARGRAVAPDGAAARAGWAGLVDGVGGPEDVSAAGSGAIAAAGPAAADYRGLAESAPVPGFPVGQDGPIAPINSQPPVGVSDDPAEQVASPRRWARQSASRRYR